MLVITRKINERFLIKIAGATLPDGTVIERDIVVTLVDMVRGKCKLGIDAQKEIGVYRQELHDHIYGESR